MEKMPRSYLLQILPENYHNKIDEVDTILHRKVLYKIVDDDKIHKCKHFAFWKYEEGTMSKAIIKQLKEKK